MKKENKEMPKELVLNGLAAWDIDSFGLFISKRDDSGSIWLNWKQFEDLKKLIKMVEDLK